MIPENLKGKRAIGYVRVSTSEQKDHGFSLPNQKDRVKTFCKQQGIILESIIEEDYSAKNFDRPAFNELIKIAAHNKTSKNKIDFILVTAWDRFSRQLSEAVVMMERFANYGIEINCVQDWKNLNISTDFLSHSFQMTFARYENMLKSERVKDGNYKALESGRYPSRPPKGYKPSTDELGKPLMVIDEENASFVRSILEDYSTGKYSQNQLIIKYRAAGFKVSKSNLSRMLANSVYCSKNVITDPRTGKEKTVSMLHEPLISETTFKRNQYYLNKKQRNKDKPSKDKEELPLRGILVCPKCNRNMTGYTKVKPNGKRYSYYVCGKRYGCGEIKFNADRPHQNIKKELSKITPSYSVMRLFEKVLISKYESLYKTREKEKQQLLDRKEAFETKIDELTEKWIEGKIKGGEATYDRLYEKYDSEIKEIDEQIELIPMEDESLEKYLKFGLTFLSKIDFAYEKADVKTKKMILGSILTEKLIFDGEKYRTLEFREVVKLICRNTKGFRESEIKKGGSSSETSRYVPGAGLEPARPEEHRILSPACLPIPPSGHLIYLTDKSGKLFQLSGR